MLFIFALFASGYVLKIGLEKKEKTTHELLIKCVIIITSVVPRQFPMQMAMAVNMALMTLNKVGIFCTEPYRVPLAGKVSHCLFDKTGTLTTDQLVPVGIINHNTLSDATPTITTATTTTSSSSSSSKLTTTSTMDSINITSTGRISSSNSSNIYMDGDECMILPELGPVLSATAETALILAACHSLVVVDDSEDTPVAASTGGDAAVVDLMDEIDTALNKNANLVGDPIELAAIRGDADDDDDDDDSGDVFHDEIVNNDK